MSKKRIKQIDSKNKICFGSRIERNRLPQSNPKPTDYPGPFEYWHSVSLLKKYPNKTGYSLLASRTPRDKDHRNIVSSAPPVGSYDIDPHKPAKQNCKPFSMGAKLVKDVKYLTPAPGTYSFFKRKVRVCTSFGKDRITVPLVNIICNQFNMAYCWKCETTPIGDYWHKTSTNQDMCRPCMEDEWTELKKCATKVLVRHRKRKELNLYHRVRYCEFFHEHNCTEAAVQHMPTKDFIFKLRKENYLASYGM